MSNLIDLMNANTAAWSAYRAAGGVEERKSDAGHSPKTQKLWDAGMATEQALREAFDHARYHGGDAGQIAVVAQYFEDDRAE